jgi:hypothetical protein
MSLVTLPNSLDKNLAAKLRKATPEELASWQKGWNQHTAEWILAEKEWQRRLADQSAYWQRMSAWIGVVGAVAGALIAVFAPLAIRSIGAP